MEIEKIKPLVNEYAKNLSLLFITNEPVEIRSYLNFFKFLFKKLHFISDTQDAFELYSHYQDSIDLVIVHVSGEVEEFRALTKDIRKLSDDIFILAFTTDEDVRKQFALSSCFCADGFIPTPFDKDNSYKYLYRFLKRIFEKQEYDEYVQGLESEYQELLKIEKNFSRYLKKLNNLEYIDKEKLITELTNIENRVQDNIEIQENHIKETQTHAITQEKRADIRFTQNDKISASEFIETLDDTIIDKAEDFLGMLDEYALTLDEFVHANAVESLSHISSLTMILREFYYTVDTLSAFPVIVRTFDTMINFLNSISAAQLEDKDKKLTLMQILEGLGSDLESWITNLFIDRVTEDIHYFDASFANNTLEMEAIFTQTEIESDEDDLEFF